MRKKSSGCLTIWEILLQKFATILFLQALLEGFRKGYLHRGNFIAEGVSYDGGLDKEIDKVGLSTLERSFRALIYANLLSADGNEHSIFYQVLQTHIRNTMLDQGLYYLSKEKDKIIQRKVYAEVPPRVEYSLTEMGQKFRVVLDAVENWGLDYIKLLKM